MKKETLLTIWGDCVSLRDLIQAIIVSVIFTMGGYTIAPATQVTQQLFFGLGGAVLGFIINAWLIKPKRVVQRTDALEREDADG